MSDVGHLAEETPAGCTTESKLQLAYQTGSSMSLSRRVVPEGLLVVPLGAGQQLCGAAPTLLVIVPLLQVHLGVLRVGEGYPHHNDCPGVGVGEVQAL